MPGWSNLCHTASPDDKSKADMTCRQCTKPICHVCSELISCCKCTEPSSSVCSSCKMQQPSKLDGLKASEPKIIKSPQKLKCHCCRETTKKQLKIETQKPSCSCEGTANSAKIHDEKLAKVDLCNVLTEKLDMVVCEECRRCLRLIQRQLTTSNKPCGRCT